MRISSLFVFSLTFGLLSVVYEDSQSSIVKSKESGLVIDSWFFTSQNLRNLLDVQLPLSLVVRKLNCLLCIYMDIYIHYESESFKNSPKLV